MFLAGVKLQLSHWVFQRGEVRVEEAAAPLRALQLSPSPLFSVFPAPLPPSSTLPALFVSPAPCLLSSPSLPPACSRRRLPCDSPGLVTRAPRPASATSSHIHGFTQEHSAAQWRETVTNARDSVNVPLLSSRSQSHMKMLWRGCYFCDVSVH